MSFFFQTIKLATSISLRTLKFDFVELCRIYFLLQERNTCNTCNRKDKREIEFLF